MKLPIFKTPRLILREVQLSDAETYEKHFVDYAVIAPLASSSVPWPYPKGGVKTFLEEVVFPSLGTSRWMWGLFLKSNPDELIGCIDLWREGRPENRGFWLGRAFWGQGLMTEAVLPVTNYAFEKLGFEKLIFSNAVGNSRSHRVKVKMGARLIGTRPAAFVDPQYTLSEIWELTREEWTEFLNSKSLSIRVARLGDEVGLHDAHMRSIREVCVQEHGEEEIRGWGNRPLGERWTKPIAEGSTWVIELNGVIQGFGYIHTDREKKSAYIYGLYLAREVLKQGLGEKLMNIMLDRARLDGALEVSLESSLTAHDFYKRFGFVDTGPMRWTEIGGSKVRGFPMVMKFK